MKTFKLLVSLVVLVSFIGCASNKTRIGEGAAIGGGLGAIAGGVIGNQSGHTVEGAVIGGALGATGGAVAGAQVDK